MSIKDTSHNLKSLLEPITDKKARAFLKAQWFGDMACSSGLHNTHGLSLSFEEIMLKIQNIYSDDLITALTTYALWRTFSSEPVEISLQTLETYKNRYVALTSPYYNESPQLYGRGLPALMTSNAMAYITAAAQNRGPGAVARMGVVAYAGLGNPAREHALLFLAAVSHLHPESVAGVFAIADVIEVARPAVTSEEILGAAMRGATRGATAATQLLLYLGLPIPHHADIADCTARVWETDDPTAAVSAHDHMVSSKFVVPSALLVAKRALLQNTSLLRIVVEQSYAIGGDPDTVCAISLGLVHAIYPERISTEIQSAVDQYSLSDPFEDA